MRICFKPVTCLLVLLAAPAAAQERTTEQDELRRFRDLGFEQRTEQETDGSARRDMERFHGKAKEAADLLAKLLSKSDRLFSHVTTLLTSDDGKRLATDRQSVLAVQRLEQTPPVSLQQVRTNKKLADMIVEASQQELSLGSVGRRPTDKTWDELNDLFSRAKHVLPIVDTDLSSLEGLIQNAPKGIDLAATPTLRAVIDDTNAKQLQAAMDAILEGRHKATQETRQTLVDATYLAELRKAAEKAKDIETQSQIEVNRIRLDYELRLERARQEENTRRVKTELALKEANAELERMKTIEEAERHARNIEAGNQARETFDDAELERKRSQAQSPEVQELLKPFITKAYYQPGNKSGFERTGVSFALIRSRGALERSERGLRALYTIGNDKKDKERPRLGLAKRWKGITPQQRDHLKNVQDHLIDLGEVLVELKMLAP